MNKEPNNTELKSIGSRLFVDGVTRDVYFNVDGRQFVIDDDGKHFHGVWIYISEPDIQSRT